MAKPLLPFITAARAAHREFAANYWALLVNRAAGCVGIDRCAPAIFALGQCFQAALVAVDQPFGDVIVGHQHDGKAAANGFTARTLHTGIHALGVGIDALGVGVGEGVHPSA